jgi:hypothetical protein
MATFTKAWHMFQHSDTAFYAVIYITTITSRWFIQPSSAIPLHYGPAPTLATYFRWLWSKILWAVHLQILTCHTTKLAAAKSCASIFPNVL